jgi:hypothetical protein
MNNPLSFVDPSGLCPGCPGQSPQTFSCGHGFTVPDGQNPATWCYNHMGIGSGSMIGAFFSQTADEFDLIGFVLGGQGGTYNWVRTSDGEVQAWAYTPDQLANQLNALLVLSSSGVPLPVGPAVGPTVPKAPDNRPSCSSVFWSALGGEASPTGEAVQQGAETASNAVAQTTAIYVAARGLTVPLRSPYVRALTGFGEGLAFVGQVAAIGFAAADILPAEYVSAKANLTGQCQNNFWSTVTLPPFP